MEVAEPDEQLLIVAANGYGKRTPIGEYPRHARGGQGVIAHKVTDKTGGVVVARAVNDSQELILMSQDGIVLRTRVEYSRSPTGESSGIPIHGRAAEGVSIMRLAPGDAVASVAVIDMAPAPPTVAAAGKSKVPARPAKGSDVGRGVGGAPEQPKREGRAGG